MAAFFAWLPFAADFHFTESSQAPTRSYHQTDWGPSPVEKAPLESGAPFCLLGAPHCSELHVEPVKPCLLGVKKCSDNAEVHSLVQEISPPSDTLR